jgi:poly(3-hydroxybutyrate) depolymerase
MNARHIFIALLLVISAAAAALAGEPEVQRTEHPAEAYRTHYLLEIPKGKPSDKPLPLLIALHGAGDCAKNFIGIWSSAAAKAGYVLAVPTADGRSCEATGRRPMWTLQSERYILWMIEDIKKRLRIDERRVYLLGFSAGGCLALIAGLHHPDRFAAIVPCGSTVHPVLTDADLARGRKMPVRMLVGGKDRALPAIRQGIERLKSAGFKKVVVREFPELGHQYPMKENAEILSWFEGLAKKKPSKEAGAAKPAAKKPAPVAGKERDQRLASRGLEQALLLLAQGRPDVALHALEGLAARYPDTEAGRTALSKARAIRSDKALMTKIKAMRDLGRIKALFQMAENFRKNGRKDLALSYYRKIVKKAPGSAYAKKAEKCIEALK